MRTYEIIPRPTPFDWANVPSLDIDRLLWSQPVPITASAQICYDDRALYVRLLAIEPEIRAVHDAPLGMPCEDSCLEFFFSPIPGDERYFNIEFNPNCCMYLGLGRDAKTLVRLLPQTPAFGFQPVSERTSDGWRVSYEIPFAFIRHFFPGFSAVPGGTIRANCFKCGDLTAQEHYLSWNPIKSETPCFHRPSDFGCMTFSGERIR